MFLSVFYLPPIKVKLYLKRYFDVFPFFSENIGTQTIVKNMVDASTEMMVQDSTVAQTVAEPEIKTVQPKIERKRSCVTTVRQITETKRFKCPDCDYFTNKKSTMNDHRAEFCIKATPVKNIQCKMCKKWKTRRSLRLHLNNYLTGQHKATGLHAQYHT